jgi:hypothetical protein
VTLGAAAVANATLAVMSAANVPLGSESVASATLTASGWSLADRYGVNRTVITSPSATT